MSGPCDYFWLVVVVADTNTSRDYAIPGDLTKSSLIVNISPQQGPQPSTSALAQPPINPAYQGSLFRPGTTSSQIVPPPPAVPLPPNPSPAPYATSDLISPPSIQGVSGNNVYAVPSNLDLLWKEELSVMEIPRENLKMVEKLGEGQFGEV